MIRPAALTAVTVLGLSLAACSDDAGSGGSADEASSAEASATPTSPGTDGPFPIDGCVIDEESVGDVAGSDVVDVIRNGTSEVGFTPSDGDEVTLTSMGCNFETADGGEWRAHIVVTDDETGMSPTEQFDAGKGLAQETFEGLGDEAYLLSSTTFVKVDNHVFSVRGIAEGHDDADAELQRDLAEAVVVSMGGENAVEG